MRSGSPPALAKASSPDPRFWEGRRVLLTGHTGFKGSWLSLWLRLMGAQVHGVSLPPDDSVPLWGGLGLDQSEALPGSLVSSWLDINDGEALSALVQTVQPDVVLHLAAQPLVRRSYSEPLLTWRTNVLGTIHLLEALRALPGACSLVAITTDKVYANREWEHGYREHDPLGGHDPYSSSKAAAELAIASWRSSFCGSAAHQKPDLAIASMRAGNVIGGGDWSADRIVPDLVRSLQSGIPLQLRSPASTRPWQHVLEPLAAYLLLAEHLSGHPRGSAAEPPAELFCSSFNIGPPLSSNRSVLELVQEALPHWPGASDSLVQLDPAAAAAPHEAALLHLSSDRAHHRLGWRPRWGFATTVAQTMAWYHGQHQLSLNGPVSAAALQALCSEQITAYLASPPCN
jgi:CDP-glucose 4,6-dehydratase